MTSSDCLALLLNPTKQHSGGSRGQGLFLALQDRRHAKKTCMSALRLSAVLGSTCHSVSEDISCHITTRSSMMPLTRISRARMGCTCLFSSDLFNIASTSAISSAATAHAHAAYVRIEKKKLRRVF